MGATLYSLKDTNRLCRYGEVMDLNMPRDKETGKPKGFSFLMYEDQRSTVLAVDNLNGATVLGRTLRVDHVKNYKQPKIKNEDGEWIEPEEQSMNAKPEIVEGHFSSVVTLPINPSLTLNAVSEAESKSSVDTGASIDPEDPMRDYLIAKRREAKAKSKGKKKHKDETPEERRARKLRKKEKREKRLQSAAVKGVEELLNNLGKRDRSGEGNLLERSGHRDRLPSESRRSISPRRRGRSRSRDRSASRMDYQRTERSRYLDEREPHDPYERHSRRS